MWLICNLRKLLPVRSGIERFAVLNIVGTLDFGISWQFELSKFKGVHFNILIDRSTRTINWTSVNAEEKQIERYSYNVKLCKGMKMFSNSSLRSYSLCALCDHLSFQGLKKATWLMMKNMVYHSKIFGTQGVFNPKPV